MKIIESGMTFGEYSEENCFHIEKSTTYTKVNKKNGEIQIAEFLLLRHTRENKLSLCVIEAKSSSPKSNPGLDCYIIEIKEKLTNALTLGIAMCLNRHSANYSELPYQFRNLDLSSIGFKLLLVIKGHKKDWLQPLQDAMRKALKPTVRIWSLTPDSVMVINDQKARELGLLTSEQFDKAVRPEDMVGPK